MGIVAGLRRSLADLRLDAHAFSDMCCLGSRPRWVQSLFQTISAMWEACDLVVSRVELWRVGVKCVWRRVMGLTFWKQG